MANLGLFASPDDVNMSRDAAMAQMTPAQQMYMMGAKTGRTLGQGLGGLFWSKLRKIHTKHPERGQKKAEFVPRLVAAPSDGLQNLKCQKLQEKKRAPKVGSKPIQHHNLEHQTALAPR